MSKSCIRSLALAASVAAVHAAGGQRPADGTVVSQAGSTARAPDGGRVRGAIAYTIDSTEIMSSSAHTLSEVIQARVPSLSVLQSGGVAAQGAQIRSRGARSFYLASEPIVIVDGVRVDGTQDATVVAINVSSSRIDDIALADVARIDVLPGPAAAGMYGAGAAGGALVITTKHGGTAGLHASSRVQSGVGMIATSFPTNYRLEGLNSAGQTIACPLEAVAAGACTATNLRTSNPLETESPFRTAQNANGAFAVDGTVRQTSARIGIAGSRTLGVTNDDDAGRFGARANLTQHVGHSLEISANGGYLQTTAGLPVRGDVDEKSNVIANGLLGFGARDSIPGYRSVLAWTSTRERAHHWTGSANANWDAFGLLHVAGVYGRDNISELDDRVGDRGGGMSVEQGGFDHSLTTVTLSARTTEWTLFQPSLRTRTFIGYDQLRSRMAAHDSVGLVADPTLFSAASLGLGPRIVGKSVRQELMWNDRVLVGAGMRWEHWSTGLPPHFFKNGDLSWLVGRALHLDSLRVRAAYGEANNWTPGLPQWVGAPGNVFAPIAMFLPPVERVKEGEIGADFAFADRAQFSLTLYRTDASHLYAFASVVGFGPPGSANDGALRNEGIELASQIRVLRSSWLQWDATVRASTLRERVRSAGPPGTTYLVGANSGISMPGNAVNGYFARPYTYADANHDGLIGPNEIQYATFGPGVGGTSLPKREASVLSTWTLRRGLSLSALLDYRGGQKLANLNEAFRCINVLNCRAVTDRTSSLADQAEAVVGYYDLLPYVQGASFAKLREVSLRWAVPSRFAGLVGGPSAITVAGRNLATWTRYRGLDPELNEEPVSVLPRVDFAQTPIPREFLVRFDIGGGAR
ncbi:MAG TPA: TonB-dependent receptor plug domain-containing protein [Gemmatimonadaceae bacterium]